MPDPLRQVLEREGALAVLHAYGLDQVRTGQDDPWLWACVLIRHWPAPWAPDIDPAALRFGIGRIVSAGETDVQIARSGMEQSGTWCFERAGAERLRAVECAGAPALSFMGLLAGGGLPAMTSPPTSFTRDYLDISRPTHGQERALVHKGMSAPPNAGAGETRYWARTPDGRWEETAEVYARWLT